MFDKATLDECIRIVEEYAKHIHELAALALQNGHRDDWFYLETHAFAAEAIAMRLCRRVKW